MQPDKTKIHKFKIPIVNCEHCNTTMTKLYKHEKTKKTWQVLFNTTCKLLFPQAAISHIHRNAAER